MASRTAVLLIHGVGEQRPMETLRPFVRGVLGIPESATEPGFFSKPDRISKSLEMRVLRSRDGLVDFYEYYWAQLITETTYGHVLGWLRALFLRWPWRVPNQLRPIYWLTWITLVAALVSVGFAAGWDPAHLPEVSVGAVTGAVLAAIGNVVVLGFAGDAARYLSTVPSSVELRHNIRSAGLEILKGLHGKYDRIVVVGHSLGSVIAYDLVRELWSEWGSYYDEPVASEQPALKALEQAGAKLEAGGEITTADRDVYIDAQHALFVEDQASKSRWKVTDLVTVGSPLAHGAVLLANHEGELRMKQREREFPTCPPQRERVKEKDGKTFSDRYCYWFWHGEPEAKPGEVRLYQLHHAAAFSQVRWTNIYHPATFGIFGDPVGGPLAHVFGQGIHDVRLPSRRLLDRTPLAHVRYWKPGSVALDEVRKALRLELRDRPSTGRAAPP